MWINKNIGEQNGRVESYISYHSVRRKKHSWPRPNLHPCHTWDVYLTIVETMTMTNVCCVQYNIIMKWYKKNKKTLNIYKCVISVCNTWSFRNFSLIACIDHFICWILIFVVSVIMKPWNLVNHERHKSREKFAEKVRSHVFGQIFLFNMLSSIIALSEHRGQINDISKSVDILFQSDSMMRIVSWIISSPFVSWSIAIKKTYALLFILVSKI